MYNKVGYTIVGLFVIIFGTGMVWFAFWLTKGTGSQEFNRYTLYLKDSVSGLSKDAMVKLHGVNVGRVEKIAVNLKNIEEVEVVILVKGDIPIKNDMVGHTTMVGVTGMLAIEIDGGTNEATTLESGAILASKPSILSTLAHYAEPMLEDTSLLLKQIKKIFSDKNIKNTEAILAHIEHFTSRTDIIEKRVFSSLDEMDKSLQEARTFMAMLKPELQKTTQEVRAFMAMLKPKITKATKNFSLIQKDLHLVSKESLPLIKRLKVATKDLQRVMRKVEKSLDRGDYNMKKVFEPMLVDSQMLIRQISDISHTLEQSPSDLIFKSKHYRKAPGE